VWFLPISDKLSWDEKKKRNRVRNVDWNNRRMGRRGTCNMILTRTVVRAWPSYLTKQWSFDTTLDNCTYIEQSFYNMTACSCTLLCLRWMFLALHYLNITCCIKLLFSEFIWKVFSQLSSWLILNVLSVHLLNTGIFCCDCTRKQVCIETLKIINLSFVLNPSVMTYETVLKFLSLYSLFCPII